jgi:hypothetical protein
MLMLSERTKLSAAYSVDEAEVVERHAGAVLGQHADHDLLALGDRERRHAKVVAACAHADEGASILRPPPLRDVHARGDLDTRHDLGLDRPRQCDDVTQEPVHAVAQLQAARAGLEMNVRGASTDRVREHRVHEPHQRGALSGLGGILFLGD